MSSLTGKIILPAGRALAGAQLGETPGRPIGHHDEALEIADETSDDWITTEDGKKILDHEHVQRSRLRVDTRKWAASKLAPKKYGDKFQHVGEGGGPIRVRPDLSKLNDEELDALERILGRTADPG
jgi:hypothetical protein